MEVQTPPRGSLSRGGEKCKERPETRYQCRAPTQARRARRRDQRRGRRRVYAGESGPAHSNRSACCWRTYGIGAACAGTVSARSRYDLGTISARSGHNLGTISARSRHALGTISARSRRISQAHRSHTNERCVICASECSTIGRQLLRGRDRDCAEIDAEIGPRLRRGRAPVIRRRASHTVHHRFTVALRLLGLTVRAPVPRAEHACIGHVAIRRTCHVAVLRRTAVGALPPGRRVPRPLRRGHSTWHLRASTWRLRDVPMRDC